MPPRLPASSLLAPVHDWKQSFHMISFPKQMAPSSAGKHQSVTPRYKFSPEPRAYHSGYLLKYTAYGIRRFGIRRLVKVCYSPELSLFLFRTRPADQIDCVHPSTSLVLQRSFWYPQTILIVVRCDVNDLVCFPCFCFYPVLLCCQNKRLSLVRDTYR